MRPDHVDLSLHCSANLKRFTCHLMGPVFVIPSDNLRVDVTLVLKFSDNSKGSSELGWSIKADWYRKCSQIQSDLSFKTFEVPKNAQKHYLKPLRQPQVDLTYRVYLKHRNSILEF